VAVVGTDEEFTEYPAQGLYLVAATGIDDAK
jgi:hypothetical protein